MIETYVLLFVGYLCQWRNIIVSALVSFVLVDPSPGICINSNLLDRPQDMVWTDDPFGGTVSKSFIVKAQFIDAIEPIVVFMKIFC